jgi:hypothetical protein
MRNGLTQEECQGEAMLGILAGSDTTASTIRIILYCLIESPRVYRKLKEEIQKVLARGNVPSPISFKEAKEMEYLQVRAVEYLSSIIRLLITIGCHLGGIPLLQPLHPWPLQACPRRRGYHKRHLPARWHGCGA